MKVATQAAAAPRHPPAPRLTQSAFASLRSMALDPTEAYVLSRIDGITLAHEIVDACGLDTKTVSEALSRMTAMGLIEWREPLESGGSEFPSAKPEERVSGARMTTKRNIEAVRAPPPELLERFARVTHYQLLGLYSDCGSDHEIGRGYARARNLEDGTLAARFAARLGEERVLSRVISAYEVLTSPKARREYDEYLLYRRETCAIEDALCEGVRRASLLPSRAPSPSHGSKAGIWNEDSTASSLPVEKITADYLVAALRAHSPAGARRKRAERLVRDALAERDADNLVGATNALRLANSILPGCDALEGALATITQEMSKSLVSTFRAQALHEENLGMWEAAAETWEKVLLGEPGDGRAAQGLAQALLETGGDLKCARRRAKEAVKASPEDAGCHRTLARVYIAAGMTQSALRALNIAESLEAPDGMR